MRKRRDRPILLALRRPSRNGSLPVVRDQAQPRSEVLPSVRSSGGCPTGNPWQESDCLDGSGRCGGRAEPCAHPERGVPPARSRAGNGQSRQPGCGSSRTGRAGTGHQQHEPRRTLRAALRPGNARRGVGRHRHRRPVFPDDPGRLQHAARSQRRPALSCRAGSARHRRQRRSRWPWPTPSSPSPPATSSDM